MLDKIPRKYVDGGFKDKLELSQKHFEEGSLIEAFTVLYAVLEQRLKQIWSHYVRDINKKKYYDGFELRFDWEFPQIVRSLRELGELTEKEYQKFANFKSGRDKAVHVLPFPLEDDKTNMNILNQAFKSGLEADKIAYALQTKYPLIPKNDLGKMDNSEKMDEWLKRELARTDEMMKRKSEL